MRFKHLLYSECCVVGYRYTQLVSDTTEYIFLCSDGSLSQPDSIIFRLMIPREGETRE